MKNRAGSKAVHREDSHHYSKSIGGFQNYKMTGFEDALVAMEDDGDPG